MHPLIEEIGILFLENVSLHICVDGDNANISFDGFWIGYNKLDSFFKVI